MSARKYRYSKKAGALNEVALPESSSLAARTQVQTRQNPVQMRDDMESHAVQRSANAVLPSLGAGIPVGTPGHHAQTLLNPSIDPYTGRALPAAEATSNRMANTGLDPISSKRGNTMFFFTVEDGQRVRMIRKDGTVEILIGPRRVYKGSRRFERMSHYVAHPGEFLIVRFRDGRQEHHPGPAHLWFDPTEHLEITKEDSLQIAAKEAVVVYSKSEQTSEVSRRIVNGPATFVPEPGEWLHTFSWHGSKGGHKGYQKVPNALVFQKLWLMPDQMYHDIPDVRTSDDAVLTIRLMLFFELVDIETMLDTSHDPIGDFVNAATSDVVDFTGKHSFDSFKENTDKLNNLDIYRQLTSRASQCGYRINKIVYRGYGAPETLQRMHDEAIESRTRLQLERATQQQEQDLEDFKLERHLSRSERQRGEEASKASHQIELQRRRAEADQVRAEAEHLFHREQQKLDAEQTLQQKTLENKSQQEHLESLRELGVDLTKLLTQGRADRVIELRGSNGNAHLHLESETPNSS